MAKTIEERVAQTRAVLEAHGRTISLLSGPAPLADLEHAILASNLDSHLSDDARELLSSVLDNLRAERQMVRRD